MKFSFFGVLSEIAAGPSADGSLWLFYGSLNPGETLMGDRWDTTLSARVAASSQNATIGCDARSNYLRIVLLKN